MLKMIAIAVVLVGCSKQDDCERAYDKLAPLVTKQHKAAKDDKPPDRDQELAKCRTGLKAKPETQKLLDCVLAIKGTPTERALLLCAGVGGKDAGKDNDLALTAVAKHEAHLRLEKLGEAAKALFTKGMSFPIGKVGPTPATGCCATPDHKCPPATDEWTKSDVWKAFDFHIDEPSLFQYSYDSDGKTFTALAVGDPGCDGHVVTYKLDGISDIEGHPSLNIIDPQ